jgi:hypothetical protein
VIVIFTVFLFSGYLWQAARHNVPLVFPSALGNSRAEIENKL